MDPAPAVASGNAKVWHTLDQSNSIVLPDIMNWIDFPPRQPAEILAAEEALLDAAEAGGCGETLSFWESSRHFIVLGFGNKAATEVNLATCERLGIPILRRISGGGTVLQGPGVLNYALVLRADNTSLTSISSTNNFIMQRNAEALTDLLAKLLPVPAGRGEVRGEERSGQRDALRVEVQGHSDLAIGGLKCSGNAQRRKRTHLLFHGTILLHLDFDLLEKVLPMPSLQPDYRRNRPHREFLTRLPASKDAIKQALSQAWSATEQTNLDLLVEDWRASVQRLIAEKYSRTDWNFRV